MLPSGEWWTLNVNLIALTALDARGAEITGTRIQQIVEGCTTPLTSPTPRVELPATGNAGHGGDGTVESRWLLMPAILLTAVGIWFVRYRPRQR